MTQKMKLVQKTHLLSVFLAGLLLSGCEKDTPPPAVASTPIPAQAASSAPAAPIQKADIDKALATVVTRLPTETPPKPDSEGATDYPVKIGDRYLQERHNAKYATIYYMPTTAEQKGMYEIFKANDGAEANLYFYISIMEPGKLRAFFVPQFNGKSWLLFSNIQIMADGAVIYDKSLDNDKIYHGGDPHNVVEFTDILAGPVEIEALRKIVSAKEVRYRLTGKTGHVDMNAVQIKKMTSAAKTILTAYDALHAAFP